MGLKSIVLIVIFMMVLQGIAIAIVTRLNKEYFDGRPVSEYNLAINDLSKLKPYSALIIRSCYAAFLIEFFFAVNS